MAVTLACIGGRSAYNLLQDGAFIGERVGPRDTPFGPSQAIFRCKAATGGFYFLSRHGEFGYDRPPAFVNYRANIYALKDLGSDAIVAWSEVRAISHNYTVGQFVVIDDLVDETVARAQTFFENRDLGHVRQWPVFCPNLRQAFIDSLAAEELEFADRGVYVCVEGPRHETPAETRKYAAFGGELLGQAIVPEVFLAKELQMCYAALCYVGRYAEDGTNYRPFEDGRVLDEQVERRRAVAATERIPRILERFCRVLSEHPARYTCTAATIPHYGNDHVPGDWRSWFTDMPDVPPADRLRP